MSTTTTTAAQPAPKPINPVVSEINRPFWDACRDKRLIAQRCTQCGELRHPAAPVCPQCLATGYEWKDLSGRGELFSYIVIHRGYHPWWAQRVPYNVALIELEEGLRMFSNVVGTPNDQLQVGQKVKVAFEQRDDDLIVPVFELDSR
jgi:uncharacterized OB-fold protein